MSAWDLLEKVVMSQPVALPLSRRELFVVREAHAAWVRRTLDESSAWQVLQLMEDYVGGGSPGPGLTKAVKGLTPRQVQLIRNIKGSQVQSKTGNTGEVVMLAPNDWLRVKQELEAQPGYYDKLLGGVESSADLVDKIQSELQLAMGSKPASAKKPLALPGNGMSGKPDEMTPALHGAEQYPTDAAGKPAGVAQPAVQLPPMKPSSPFGSRAGGEDAAARRRRVAAQDAAMMGGKTQPIGRVRVQGENYECEEGEEQ